MTDPLEHFEQQFWSKEFLDQHGPRLRDEAVRLLRKHRDAEVAGLIADPASPAGAALCRLFAQATGKEVLPEMLVGLVPRQMLAVIIAQSLEFMAAQGAPLPPEDRLAVVCATRDGMRVRFFPLDESE